MSETWKQKRSEFIQTEVESASRCCSECETLAVKTAVSSGIMERCYNKGRADLLEDAKVLERRIEIMASEIKACMDKFPQNGMYPSIIFAEDDLAMWRTKTEVKLAESDIDTRFAKE